MTLIGLIGENHAMALKILSSLHRKDGVEVKYHRASSSGEEIGDMSYFYIPGKSGSRDWDVVKYFDVERTAMGAWQLYLLENASTFLPAWWHGLYDCREYIFCEKDLKKIKGITRDSAVPFEGVDTSVITEQYDLAPKVTILQDKEEMFSAEIQFFYWNDWVGLVRNSCIVEISNGEASIRENPEGSNVIYEYDCGIRF